MKTLKEVLQEWVRDRGYPSLIATCRCNEFLMKELMHNSNVKWVTLPDNVWEHNFIYLENVMYRQKEEFIDAKAS